jgi:hypothetical protein
VLFSRKKAIDAIHQPTPVKVYCIECQWHTTKEYIVPRGNMRRMGHRCKNPKLCRQYDTAIQLETYFGWCEK